MLVELPERYTFSAGEVEDSILFIYSPIGFEKIMYEITHYIRGRKCVYCGETLLDESLTLDHRYPRMTGGISITNNLFPCCPKCNITKSCLTHEEFLKARELSKEERKKYLKKIERNNRIILRRIGYKLPRKWVKLQDTESVLFEISGEYTKGKIYEGLYDFYVRNRRIQRPLIVDRYNRLLDGLPILMLAMEFGITQIPVISLENVETTVLYGCTHLEEQN